MRIISYPVSNEDLDLGDTGLNDIFNDDGE